MEQLWKVSGVKIVKTLVLEYPTCINFERWIKHLQDPSSSGGLGFSLHNYSVVYLGNTGSEEVHIRVIFKESIYPYHPRIFVFEGVTPVIKESL